jgi:DNA processing protein
LIRRIGEQGLLLAELPPSDHPTRSRFIMRNRVIAALTRGTVVVEAALRSGSLSTARHARRLGRLVMGVPGPVTSGLSAGVHELLREEGSVITDAAEVIELVGSMGELAPRRRGPAVPRDVLPGEAALVLDALPGRGSAETAPLAQTVGITPETAQVRLQELCALGFVERVGGGWQLSRATGLKAGHSIE